MTGEWLFAVAAFGEQAGQDDDAYFAAFPGELARAAQGGKDAAYLSSLRHELLPGYIDECLALVDWGRYNLVGFTSTFQQNVASLALARRIKEAFPQVKIVFGGANMEDEMGPEYARAFPFLDYVVVGEGDRVFVAILHGLANGRSLVELPGVVTRRGDRLHYGGQAPPTRELDWLPTPDYDEYFARVHRLGLLHHPQVGRMIPLESSRGCWWGQKHHCTFCGLNGLGMAFRSKSPGRILAELAELTRRHSISFFGATDNILDMKHVQPLFGAIAEARTDYQFFYEVKANLTPAQVRALHRGGVRWVQPGIESLSSHVLQLMRKGSTMLQNVRLLKWCRYYRIRVSWNLIWGFPGETVEDYEQELAVLRLISHLEPPHGCTRIWLERFSPYFFDRDQFPVREVQAESSYRFVYPPSVDLDKIAYFFDYRMDDTLPDEAHVATQRWVEEWKQRQASDQPDTLFYRRTQDALLVDDNRRQGQRGTHPFYGPLALAYEFCSETMRTVPNVAAHLSAADGSSYREDEVRDALEEFCARGLMVTEEGRYLSLALPTNPNW
jgi:ribosomal peptide maturation radical SAM protein 1